MGRTTPARSALSATTITGSTATATVWAASPDWLPVPLRQSRLARRSNAPATTSSRAVMQAAQRDKARRLLHQLVMYELDRLAVRPVAALRSGSGLAEERPASDPGLAQMSGA